MMEYYLILGQLDYDGTLFDLSYVFIWGYEYSVASSFACCQPYGYCRERIVQHHTQNEVGWYFIYIANGLAYMEGVYKEGINP